MTKLHNLSKENDLIIYTNPTEFKDFFLTKI
jgi:hypothetical protein